MEKDIAKLIADGSAALGIEFGSTRIKAVLVDSDNNTIASGSHTWENRFIDGVWTYHLSDVKEGLQSCYKDLKKDVKEKYGVEITKIKSMCFSAMMHGYLVFDKNDNQLAEFRTWRNTMTSQAAEELTELFSFNIPQRWSIAHLYQAILNGEEHISEISHLTTLAGYVHYMLTGKRVLGIGEASGVFPIDSEALTYDERMVKLFDEKLSEKKVPFRLFDILPGILLAGEEGGRLTKEGALFLDPAGTLEEGSLVAPPEGDAGTGMVATNSIKERTGNVSAGTSVFAMAVLEKALKGVYPEIDMVTTPAGKPVAMVHCNNCCSDIDAWAKLFSEFLTLMGLNVENGELYNKLYTVALSGDSDCGGLLSYNYLSGESVTKMEEGGRPMFIRTPDASFTLSNFMRDKLYSACATLKIGMDILFEKEKVEIDRMFGHGGFFKTKDAGQSVMAAALGCDVAVMETASEGGAWGAAVLANFAAEGKGSLAEYLESNVFASAESSVMTPDEADVEGFKRYMEKYKAGLSVEREAVNNI